MPGTEQLDLYLVHRVGLAVLSIFLLGLVLELVRRGYLKERYALLWLGTALAGLVIGVFPRVIILLSNLFHFQFLTVIVILSFLFVLFLMLSFTIVISRLAERNRQLAQEVALLSNRVKKLERRDEA